VSRIRCKNIDLDVWHGVYGVTVRLRGREWFIGAIVSGGSGSPQEEHP